MHIFPWNIRFPPGHYVPHTVVLWPARLSCLCGSPLRCNHAKSDEKGASWFWKKGNRSNHIHISTIISTLVISFTAPLLRLPVRALDSAAVFIRMNVRQYQWTEEFYT